mmetsp:Transcript_2120/g.3014  ORF Transcript_2120/g.3014 Transcript_2120/m.3014 type:complete len:233 (-) Transcript_2120:552-1250(-)
MKDAPRVVVRVALPDASFITMSSFGDRKVLELRSTMEEKMVSRNQKLPKKFQLEIEGKVIENEEINLWTLAFTYLKQFPKMITLTLSVSEFDEGWYTMTVRTNMRAEVSVASDKIVTLEKEDLVYVQRVAFDEKSKAIRGFVRPATEWVIGERILFSCQDLQKHISARVISNRPLNVKTADSRSIHPDWRDKEIIDVSEDLLVKAEGWISLKSSAGQVCVQAVDLEQPGQNV